MCDLFKENAREWDEMKVASMFSTTEARRICCIPLGAAGRRDRLAWRFTKDGVYTARSGYFDVLRSENEATGYWSKIWKLPVIPKVQYFIWRVMHGILPTCINLVSRFVDISPF